ncbi:MAG: GNAT family N-acetyltransferase [Sporichthyaceae bacterium]
MVPVTDEPWESPDGKALRTAQRVELDARYGADLEPGAKPTAEDVAVFVVARDEHGRAVGCGALRRLDDRTVEVKRLYAEPVVRGTGVATTLLRALEARAADRGWTTLRLETGDAQPEAIRFWLREGYRPIPPYGHYVGSAISMCFERTLAWE